MSFMKKVKSIGPRMLLSGTPETFVNGIDKIDAMFTVMSMLRK